ELNKLDQPKLASREPMVPPSTNRPSTEETRAWAKVEDSTDISALRGFIDRYPNSPLAISAQSRIDILQRNSRERELERQAKAANEREAALRSKLAEVDRLKNEREAAAQRAADERRAKEATDAERQRLD